MNQEDYDKQFKEERSELAELEYSDPLALTLEDEEDISIIECTCIIDTDSCELHPKIESDEL